MKIFRERKEAEEIKPVGESTDKGKVVTPSKPDPTKNKDLSDTVKGMIAVDALTSTIREASIIHGMSETAVHNLTKTTPEGQEVRAIQLMRRHEIADVATAKLMQTLDLLSPHEIDKETDKITVIQGLSKVLEKMNGDNKEQGSRTVHLHLYAPNQRSEKDYEVINVSN
jgi:hypothetical protein